MGYTTADPNWSPNYTDQQNGLVGVVIHHAATTDFWGIGRTFENESRQASAHWGVGDGIVQQYVDEDKVAWHAGNWWANCNTIGIENANSSGDPDWAVSEETVQTLCELLADISARHGMGHFVRGQNLWGHRDFAQTYCPGVLYDRLDEIAERANAIMDGGSVQQSQSTTKRKKTHMECIIVNAMGTGVAVYFDGHDLHDLAHPDDIFVLNTIHNACYGTDIPCLQIDGIDANGVCTGPFSARLRQVVQGGDPLPVVPGMDGFPPRCPR